MKDLHNLVIDKTHTSFSSSVLFDIWGKNPYKSTHVLLSTLLGTSPEFVHLFQLLHATTDRCIFISLTLFSRGPVLDPRPFPEHILIPEGDKVEHKLSIDIARNKRVVRNVVWSPC